MPRTRPQRLRLVAQVCDAQDGLITAAQLAEIGCDSSSIRHRVRQGGAWLRVLPGIYSVSGPVHTVRRRLTAARLYVGEPAMLTGLAALALHGATTQSPSSIDVLIPHERKRKSHGFVHVERTVRWPSAVRLDGWALAPVPRAAVDACRRMDSRREVRALLSSVVQREHCTVAQLTTELAAAQRRRTALAREAVGALSAGPRSAPEIELHELWSDSELPQALWNADLYVPGGSFLARPDAYVVGAGVAVEVDSRAHHFSPEDWERTMRRHSRMTAHGLLVLHVTPHRIRTDWLGVAREIRSATDSRAAGPLPDVVIAATRR